MVAKIHADRNINQTHQIQQSDTSELRDGYNGGKSTVFAELKLGSPAHVDMRNTGKSFWHNCDIRSQMKPLKFDKDRFGDAAAEYCKKFRVTDIRDEEIRSHVAMFVDRMEFYEIHYGKLQIPLRNMVMRSLLEGPVFNDDYASWWKRSRFDWANCKPVEPVDFDVSPLSFERYSSIYPPFFLMFFVEEPMDYLWMQSDYVIPDPEILERLTDEVAIMSSELLPDLADFLVPDHVIYSPTSSNAFDGYDKCQPEWSMEFDSPETDYMDNRLIFMRGYAHKRPTESRDIGTLTPQSIRLHRSAMGPMQKACRKLNSVYGKDLDYLQRRVQYIGSKSNYYYMRDYTKSGMTIPHEVVSAVFKGFYRRRPDLAETYIKAFNNAVVYIKNSEGEVSYFYPKTGYPLGMFVEGYTILSYAIHRIIMDQHDIANVLFDANNDDVIVGFRYEDDALKYGEEDMIIQHSLGMAIKQSKTGISEDKFFYCEEYWDGEKLLSKAILYALSIIGAKYALNIVHAKELVYSTLMSAGGHVDPLKQAVRWVQEYYSPEFSKDEYRWPYLFGGWWPQYQDNLECSLMWRTGDCIPDAAYWACRERYRKDHSLRLKPTMAIGRKYDLILNEIPETSEEILSLLPLFGSKKALKSYYGLLSRSARDQVSKYRELFHRRQKKFYNILSGKEDCPSVTNGWLRRHPNSVIIRGMEGVKYSTLGAIITPKIGFLADEFEGFLSSMIMRGIITARLPKKLSQSELKVHRLGITKEWPLNYYPCPEKGASVGVFQHSIIGVLDFYERTGLFIESIDDNDSIIPSSHKWSWMPVPLTWIIRIDNALRVVPGALPLTEETAHFYLEQVALQHGAVPPDEISWGELSDSEDEDPFETVGEFKSFITSILDSIQIDNVRCKLVPLSARLDEHTGAIIGRTTLEEEEGLIKLAEGSYIDLSANNEQDFWDNSTDDSDAYGALDGF